MKDNGFLSFLSVDQTFQGYALILRVRVKLLFEKTGTKMQNLNKELELER